MRIRTVSYSVSYEILRMFIVFPLVQCRAEPLAEVHAEKLEELRAGWDSVNATKLALDDKGCEAQARVVIASGGLDRSAGHLSKAILTITADNRNDPLYTAYFGPKTLSDFKRSFRAKLATMRGWAQNLKTSEHPALAALTDEVEKAVAAADAAITMRANVRNEKRFFRDTGERKKLIDRTNIVCKSIHGDLSKIPHEVPGMPPDFADRFFLSESRDKDDEEDEGSEAIDPVEAAKAKIDAAKKDLASAEEELKQAEADKAKAAAAAAERAAEEAKLAALDSELAKKSALAEELRAKLAKKSDV